MKREKEMTLTLDSHDQSWTLVCKWCRDEWYFEDHAEALEASSAHFRWHKNKSLTEEWKPLSLVGGVIVVIVAALREVWRSVRRLL